MSPSVYRVGTLICLLPFVAAAILVRVDSPSHGRSLFVDTDKPEIRSALVEVDPPEGAAKSKLPASAHLEVVWYDDTKQILRLRNADTQKEYDFSVAGMLAPPKGDLEISTNTKLPAWMEICGGCTALRAVGPPPGWQPVQAKDLGTYHLTMEKTGALEPVTRFYQSVMGRYGIVVDNESGRLGKDYSFTGHTRDQKHHINLEISRRADTIHVEMTDQFSGPRPVTLF
jgi:hypothetical protein